MVTSLDLKAAFIFSIVMSSHVELKMSMFYDLKMSMFYELIKCSM